MYVISIVEDDEVDLRLRIVKLISASIIFIAGIKTEPERLIRADLREFEQH